MPIVPVRCEGFRGVSQSLGHHIANDTIRDHILGKGKLETTTPYDVALIGDTTSEETLGPRARCWRRWVFVSSPSGPEMRR